MRGNGISWNKFHVIHGVRKGALRCKCKELQDWSGERPNIGVFRLVTSPIFVHACEACFHHLHLMEEACLPSTCLHSRVRFLAHFSDAFL